VGIPVPWVKTHGYLRLAALRRRLPDRATLATSDLHKSGEKFGARALNFAKLGSTKGETVARRKSLAGCELWRSLAPRLTRKNW
jgi:hypothetical protein